MRIGDLGPTHGSPTAPHGLRGALACPFPAVFTNLIDIEKGYLNEEMKRLGPSLVDVAGWHAFEATVRWALDHGCQALSNGTRLDVRGALLWSGPKNSSFASVARASGSVGTTSRATSTRRWIARPRPQHQPPASHRLPRKSIGEGPWERGEEEAGAL